MGLWAGHNETCLKTTWQPAIIQHQLGAGFNWLGIPIAKEPTRALSIRQTHAEAIMRGVKTTEFRTGPTKTRGRIHIYASLGRYSAEDEAELMEAYRIEDVSCDDLPRGAIIGTVDLHDCEEGDWHVKEPERAKKLRKPKNHPQPVWFTPF